jgi:L-aspartate oxidase
MTLGAGVLRSANSLSATAAALAALAEAWAWPRRDPSATAAGVANPESWEATNLHTIATALVAAAATRQETRGSHWREDFVATDDEYWRGHVLTRLDADGTLTVTFEPTDADGAPTSGPTGRPGRRRGRYGGDIGVDEGRHSRG